MVWYGKAKRQIGPAIGLTLSCLGIFNTGIGILSIVYAGQLLTRRPSWVGAFDLAMAVTSVLFPAAGVFGFLAAQVEWYMAVWQD